MGVLGLSTFLRENRRTLAKAHQLSSQSELQTPIVVDGWSFIYDLYQTSTLPWVYGGEYDEFSRIVIKVVKAWISVGLRVYIVFDGAMPTLKFSTMVSRGSQSKIQPSLLFFRTSTASRATPRFLHESRIIPPLCYSACVDTLEAFASSTDGLEIHYADEEGDPYSVELAGRIGGYVVGTDSDFVVLNSDGYLGYIPLEEMIWSAPVSEEDQAPEDSQYSEFQTVRKSKGKKRVPSDAKSGRGVIPPDDTPQLTLSFAAYEPTTLASHLNIPVTLLPLLGALVGNDFTLRSPTLSRNMFFERQLTLSQRITRVATTLQTILSTSSQKRKSKQQVASVMDLIERTVNALLTRTISTMGTGEVEAIVDRIVEATLQYAIPKYEGETVGQEGLWPTDICALHEPTVCPILPMLSRLLAAEASELDEDDEENDEIIKRNTVRELYLDAYRKGHLSPKVMDILHTGTYWPCLFLENPDSETVSRSIGRTIRQWGYSILDDAVGLPDIDAPGEDEESGNDEDELIDVVEEDDSDSEKDYLAPLHNALHQLHGDTDSQLSISTSSRARRTRPALITEYVRRGTRVAQEEVTVPSLQTILSSISVTRPRFDLDLDASYLLLRPEEDRFTVFLHALDSDLESVRALPPQQLMVVLALRWILRALQARTEGNEGSKEREKERWTRREAQCILASCVLDEAVETDTPLAEGPLITDRNVQLMAQVLTALESVEHLSQILLLSARVPSPVCTMSGRRCHSYLTETNLGDNGPKVPPALWAACEDSLGDVFAEERRKKARKGKHASQDAPVAPPRAHAKGKPVSLFSLLGDAAA